MARQPTAQQRKALDLLVEEGGKKGKKLAVSKVMEQAGYSPATAKTPSKLLKAEGFLTLCDELGLTESFLTKALVQDIKKKPGKRTRELELGFKVRGMLKEGPSGGNTFNFILTDEQFSRIAGRITGGGIGDGGVSGEEQPGGLRDSYEPEIHTELAPREDSQGT